MTSCHWQPQEALFFGVEAFEYRFLPGQYPARLHYESKRSLEGVTEVLPPAAEKAFMRVWEGSAVSDWVAFAVQAPPNAELHTDWAAPRR